MANNRNYLLSLFPPQTPKGALNSAIQSPFRGLGRIVIGFLLLAISCFGVNAAPMQGIPKRPNPPKLVNNFSTYQILSRDQMDALETKLDAFANSTSNQIAIVIIDSLYDHDMSEFATELGQEWQIGQKKI